MLCKLIICAVWAELIFAAPAPTKAPTPSSPPQGKTDPIVENVEPESMNTGLFYDQYLQKVIKLLESNEEFKKKMENANFDDIKDGKLSNEVNFMPLDIRNELNALKKEEMNRLRKILHAKVDLDKGRKVKKSNYLKQIANHLDHDNPHTFEAADLTNLIKAATSDLENFDKERHEEFKKYEMNKELQREEKMRQLDEEERKKAKEDYLKQQKEMAEKTAVHHPASKEQLDDVWKSEDGLTDEEFNPKTFFYIHDLNGDGYLDSMELEALFEKDLGNAYNSSDPNVDLMQMEEERRRMREHVMKEVDKDNNGLISLDEFLAYTSTDQFAEPDKNSYQTIDEMLLEHTLYTQDELERYRSSIQQQEAEIKSKLEVLKSEARNLGEKRKELNSERNAANKDGLREEEKLHLKIKEEEVKQQEEKVQAIHKDLQQQSKEVLQMKQEVVKHEAGEKIADNIKQKLDSLPPGEEKDKAVEEAHKQLEDLKKSQGLPGHEDVKEAEGEATPSDAPPPPSQP